MRSRVKCIVDQLGFAIYFSRGICPANKKGEVDKTHKYLLHLGLQALPLCPPALLTICCVSPLCPVCLIDVHAPLQCYDRAFLRLYGKLPATPLMLQEDLEQLKARKRQSGLFQLTANAQVTEFGPTAGHGAWVQDVCRGGRPFRTWRGRAGGALPAFPVC